MIDLSVSDTYNKDISVRNKYYTQRGLLMLIGREVEIKRLEKAYMAKEAEFIVLYGRRRVGKTFLVRQFFANKKCTFFQATGLQKGDLNKQLSNFAEAISRTFIANVAISIPKNWNEAFKILDQFITATNTKIVIFLDELPWMATRRSGLLEEIDYYWNQYWSRNPKIILIVCGSSASWLIKNIIYNKGGLHNRCTAELKLDPFTLSETKKYLHSKGIKLNLSQILDIYMALGGIPYYLNHVEPGLSAIQNIQNIIFTSKSPLQGEFKKLFASLFVNADKYIELIRLIAKRKSGISRAELESLTKNSHGGGRLTQRLTQLEQTSFITAFIPWNKQNGEWYKVTDEFCMFYLYWIDGNKNKIIVDQHWLQQTNKPIYQTWAGYAFEAICYKHINHIINALHIKYAESVASWRFIPKDSQLPGAQIDLLIDRVDECINICEIKYTNKPFTITKQYAENLSNKVSVFKNHTKTRKQLFVSLISANGMTSNQYSNEMINGVVVLEDLFNANTYPRDP